MIEEQSATIYVLCDSQEWASNRAIRYVGQTRSPLIKRLKQHLKDAKARRGINRRIHWLRARTREGMLVVIREIERVPISSANEAEMRWIAFFRAMGCDLVNSTDGGKAGTTVSSETRQRMSLAWLDPEVRCRRITATIKRQNKPEERARISAHFKRVWKDSTKQELILASIRDPKNRAIRSAAFKKMWQDGDKRLRIRTGQETYIRSPEIRQVYSQRMRGRWADPIAREKMLKGIRDALGTVAWREKRSDLSRVQWQNPNYRTPERIAKMGSISRAAWGNPTQREKILESRKKAYDKAEVKAKFSEHGKKIWADAEIRNKIVAGMKAAWQRPEVREKYCQIAKERAAAKRAEKLK